MDGSNFRAGGSSNRQFNCSDTQMFGVDEFLTQKSAVWSNFVMVKKILILIFLFSWVSLIGQNVLKGRLIDSISNEPIEYALLYIDGSTKSTTSNTEGMFSFTIPNLPAQIEVSHLNYQPMSLFVEVEMVTDDVVTIAMAPRENILDDVLILDKRTRQEYLNRFKEEFLGVDYWGRHAKLLNDDCLLFSRDERKLSVSATEPLVVDMPKLGYQVSVDLLKFVTESHSFNTSSATIVAKYHFEDVSNRDKKIANNRKEVYFNSRQHFLRSLFRDQLLENGFNMFENFSDTASQQVTSAPVDLGDSLIRIDDRIKLINLKDHEYQILYYSKKGYPLDLTKHKPKSSYEPSSLHFRVDSIYVFSDGTSPSSDIRFSGHMGIKRVGAMLPSDY